MSDLSVTSAAIPNANVGARAAAPLAVVMRGDAADSVHVGSVAVVDRGGRLLYSAGDSAFPTMTRSSLKPFQAMPFVAGGGIERFDFSPPQVALLCASHSGEPRHVAAAASMLAKAGNKVEDLQCGSHAPRYHDIRGEPTPPPPYSALENNCSGKHSGMLAYCVMCELPKASYLAYDHPLQQGIRSAVSHFTSTPEAELKSGIDGREVVRLMQRRERDECAEVGEDLGRDDRRASVPRAAVHHAVPDTGDARIPEARSQPGAQHVDRATPVQAGIHRIVGNPHAAVVASRETRGGADAVDLPANIRMPAGRLAAEDRELQAR